MPHAQTKAVQTHIAQLHTWPKVVSPTRTKWFHRCTSGAESLDRLLTLDKTNPLSFDKLVLDWARMALIGWAVDQPVEPLFTMM